MRPTVALLALALLAGCLGPSDGGLEAASLPASGATSAPTGPDVEAFEGDVLLSVATPARTVNNGGAFIPAVLETDANTTGYVLELEWTAASPASEELSLWVRPEGTGAVSPDNAANLADNPPPTARADGPSPLRLALPIADLSEAESFDVVVRAAGQAGAAAQQTVTLHVTTFRDVAFDPDFSALGDVS